MFIYLLPYYAHDIINLIDTDACIVIIPPKLRHSQSMVYVISIEIKV